MATGMSGSSFDSSLNGKWLARFLTIWTPQVVSLLGGGVVQFALVWWVASQTDSAFLVSLAAAMTLVPRVVLNPVIGALVDRWSRRATMIAANGVVVVCSTLLGVLFLGGRVEVEHVLLVLLVRSTADTFYTRAVVASTSMLVPASHLTRVSAVNQAMVGVMLFVTPGVGAILLESSSFVAVMAIDFSAAVLAIVPLAFLCIPQIRPDRGDRSRAGIGPLLGDIAEGLRYLRNWTGAFGMLVLAALMNFVMQPFFLLLAVFVRNSLNGGEVEYGLLGAAIGLGFLSGGTVLGIWQGFRRRMVTSLAGMLGAGLAVFVAGFAKQLGLAPCLVVFFVAGAMMPFCMGPIQALVQIAVKGDMQGRVFSIMECFSTSVAPVALLLAGRVFDTAGPQYWYWLGGIAAIGLALFGWSSPNIRNLGVTN